MALAGRLGLTLSLADVPRADDVDSDCEALFAESSGRFLVEVAPEDVPAFERAMAGYPTSCIGRVAEGPSFRVKALHGDASVECDVSDLCRAWQSAQPGGWSKS
jgi:phosphoribosylformylglycinamidine (FGAM) synthase-like enzyme